MKKMFCFLAGMFVTLSISAQSAFFVEVPVVDDKVVFLYRIDALGKQSDVFKRIATWLEKDFVPAGAKVRVSDKEKGMFVIQNLELLSVDKKFLSNYQLRFRYNLVIECTDNLCTVQLRNISYQENREPEGRTNEEPPIMPAETILLGDSYNVAFVPETPKRIRMSTLKHVNGLFTKIAEALR